MLSTAVKSTFNGARPRPRIGLALGGGVARGPAHIGVLAALEAADIPIDCIAGTSAGALVGAGYAAGLSLADLEGLARSTKWWSVARPAWPSYGIVSFARMEKWLGEIVGPLEFDDLTMPFAAVAADVTCGETVVMRQGSLVTAVRASCSVPGFVTPVWREGRWLCDGGIVDNIPVDAARALGADYVIGVDLFEPAYDRTWGPLGPLTAAIETLIRAAGGGLRDADCLVTPDLSGVSYFRFSRANQYIALGRRAMAEMVPQIAADLAAWQPAA